MVCELGRDASIDVKVSESKVDLIFAIDAVEVEGVSIKGTLSDPDVVLEDTSENPDNVFGEETRDWV